MTPEYFVPTQQAQSEFVEKCSRFITDVFPVETEEEARACLETVRKKHHDARHHCWCYRLKEGGVERYSDDGEPQGTAGQPMLNVYQRENVTNVLCVVTRYFGGILLGAGGLTRAYAKGAKDGLDAAGISVKRLWKLVDVPCPYRLYDRVKLLVEAQSGVIIDTEYGADVVLKAMFAQDALEPFQAELTELTNGGIEAAVTGEEFRAFPVR